MRTSILRFMDESSTTRTVGFHVSTVTATGGSTGAADSTSESELPCVGIKGRTRVTDSGCFPSGSVASGSIKGWFEPAKASSGEPNVISIGSACGEKFTLGLGTFPSLIEVLTVTGNAGNSALNSYDNSLCGVAVGDDIGLLDWT